MSEYGGICRTSTFGDLNQISIKIEEKVIENFEKDYENIVRMVQSISDSYERETKQAARAAGADYVAVELGYRADAKLWHADEFIILKIPQLFVER